MMFCVCGFISVIVIIRLLQFKKKLLGYFFKLNHFGSLCWVIFQKNIFLNRWVISSNVPAVGLNVLHSHLCIFNFFI